MRADVIMIKNRVNSADSISRGYIGNLVKASPALRVGGDDGGAVDRIEKGG